jgi:hypothetical protein
LKAGTGYNWDRSKCSYVAQTDPVAPDKRNIIVCYTLIINIVFNFKHVIEFNFNQFCRLLTG